MRICRCGEEFELTQKELNWQDKILLLKENCCTTCRKEKQDQIRHDLETKERHDRHLALVLRQSNAKAVKKMLNALKHKGNRV